MTDPALIVSPLRQKLEADEVVLFMSLRQMRSPDVAMMIRECGFDGFYVDCEHGAYSRSDMAALCAAGLMMGLTPAVRVLTPDPGEIGAALDAGAQAVIVPHVGNAAAAQAAVEAVKYPPLGHRSVMALGTATRYRNLPLAEIVRLMNKVTFLIAMLETEEGIANAEAIAAVPGVDALMVGPADLSAELGIPGESKHARITAACHAAVAAARKHGKHFVAGAGGPDAADMVARGARILTGGTDVSYMMSAAREAASAMRARSKRKEEKR